MNNAHEVTRAFEKAVAEYTGAPYCIAVENACSAIFLALKYENIEGKEISIPCHTYVGVPCEIINAGGKVRFYRPESQKEGYLKGAYQLQGSRVWDSALRFTADCYIPGSFMCCSFTGPYKHLKLGKGGCILTDDEDAYKWFKKMRFSGRDECSYHDQKSFDIIGHSFYMNPVIAELGLLNMTGFLDNYGKKKIMPDIELPYPDLSKHPIFTK